MMKRLLASIAVAALVSACGDAADSNPTQDAGAPAASVTQAAGPTTEPASPMEGDDTDSSGEASGEAEDVGPIEGEGLDLPTWVADEGTGSFTCAGVDFEGNPDPASPLFRFTLPTDESHEAIQAMETLRDEYGISEKPNYVLVEIDATKIEGPQANVAGLEWSTLGYDSMSAESAWELVGEWQSELVDDADLYNKGVDLYNMLIDTPPNRGAKGYDLLVADEPIESMVAPYMMAGGMTMAPCERE